MQAPALPPDEAERLAALRRLRILDTEPGAAWDRIVRLAAELCDVPMALVCLVDDDRQWFKARLGMDAQQTTRDVSFCGHAILQDELFSVPDARADPRFQDNPLVTGPANIQAYHGFPLAVGGHNVGTVCVMDHEARALDPDQRDALGLLADLAQDLLELRADGIDLDEELWALDSDEGAHAAAVEAWRRDHPDAPVDLGPDDERVRALGRHLDRLAAARRARTAGATGAA